MTRYNMKVALVHDYLYEYGGAERVLETLHEMFPDAPVYTGYYFPETMPENFKSWNIRTSKLQKVPFLKNFKIWFVYFLPWCFEQFDLSEYDLIISSVSFAAKGVITHPNQTHICYCHTPPRFLWGLNTQMKRGWLVKKATEFLNIFFRKWDFAASQRVDHFVANSMTVQKRIKDFYQRDSEVIYPACRIASDYQYSEALKTELGSDIPQNYFLVASRLYKQKHVDLIVEAFNVLNLPLVILGRGNEENYLKSIAKQNIKFVGFVSEKIFPLYCAHCRALITASENEDFGMTPPEVNGYGKPAIAHNSGGHTETVIDGLTGILFDDLTVESIIKAIRRFEESKFEAEKIRENAKRFSIDQFKSKINSLVERTKII